MKITQKHLLLIMISMTLHVYGSVANITSSSIATVVYNVANSLVDDTQQAWNNPRQVAFIPGTNKAYVTNQAQNNGFVSIIDTLTDTVTGTVSTGDFPFYEPTSIAVTSDGVTAFVGNISGNEPRLISIIDTASDTVVGYVIDENNYITTPYGITISADNNYIYIANGTEDSSVVIATITNNSPGEQAASTTAVSLTNVTPYAQSIAVIPNSSYICVVGDEGGSDYPFTIMDTTSYSALYNIYGNANYYGYSVAVNPDGSYAYAANYYGSLAIIDLVTKDIITTTVGNIQYPTSVIVAPDNSTVYVANYDNGDIPAITFVAVGSVTPLGNVQDQNEYFSEGLDDIAIDATLQKMYAITPAGSVIVVLPLVAPNMTITSTKNQFLMQSVITSIIKLQAPVIGITPENFEVYQNGVLIETIPYVAGQEEYVVVMPYLQPATSYNYSVRSIDASGNSSLYNVATIKSVNAQNGR